MKIKEVLNNSNNQPIDESWRSLATKFGGPVANSAFLIWDAWSKIKDMPTNIPKEKYRSNVAKIIGEVVAETSLFMFGAFVGAAIAGAITGPGAVVGFIAGGAGGLALQYKFQGKLDELVDKVVDFFYPEGADKETSSTTTNASSGENTNDSEELPDDLPKTSPAVKSTTSTSTSTQTNTTTELQSKLKIQSTGTIDDNTINAINSYIQQSGLSGPDALAKLLGVSTVPLSEAEEIAYLKEKLTQLDEFKFEPPSWLEKGAAKVGIRTASRIAADNIGPEVKVGKEIFKQAGDSTVYYSQTGVRKSAEELDLLVKAGKAKPNLPTAPKTISGVPGGTTYVAPNGLAYTKSAKNGKWYKADGQGSWTPVKDPIELQSVEKHAAASGTHPTATTPTPTTTTPTTPVTPPAASSRIMTSLKNMGGRIVNLLKQPKFLAAIAAIGAAGYFWGKDGKLTKDNQPEISKEPTGNQDSGQGSDPATQQATEPDFTNYYAKAQHDPLWYPTK